MSDAEIATGAALVGVLGTLLGAFLGFVLSEWAAGRREKKRTKGSWALIAVEVQTCSRMAREFLENLTYENEDKFHRPPRDDYWRKKTPDYRLPNSAFNSAVPLLLADGAISEPEITAMSNYNAAVASFNNGLDKACAIRSEDLDHGKGHEFTDQLTCNCSQAAKLISQSELHALPLKTQGTALPAELRHYLEEIKAKPTSHDEIWSLCKKHL